MEDAQIKRLRNILGDDVKGIELISGSERKQDLIPCFMNFFKKNAIEEYKKFIYEYNYNEDCFWPEGDDHEYWESDDAEWLVDELIEILSIMSPVNYYFGKHSDDLTKFGFWKLPGV